jgi:hypothetical protein
MVFPLAVDKGLANTYGEADREAFGNMGVYRMGSNVDDPCRGHWCQCTQMVVAAGSSSPGVGVGR